MSFELETEVRKWRDQLRATGRVATDELEELESHLRDGIDELVGAGLDPEEAFLIAVRRLGSVSQIGEEFSKVPTENLWRQMVLGPPDAASIRQHTLELGAVVILGLFAGLLSRIPMGLGFPPPSGGHIIYVKNVALFALPGVAVYLMWKRQLSWKMILPVALIFVASAFAVNLYPSYEPQHSANLIGIHLPIVLWLTVGLAYSGAGWRRSGIRMDFVRFSGETFIYGVLIGCGGMVLVFATVTLFDLVGVDANQFVGNTLAPFGGLAIPIVAVYLAERKKTVIENIAPVLARIFTPLFLALIVSVLIAVPVTGGFRDKPEVMIALDLVLAVVLALVLYTMSARDVEREMLISDWLTLALLIAALVLDAFSMSAIIFRLTEYGVSVNKVAALGENVVLLINLAGLAVAYVLFAFRKTQFRSIVNIQMKYLPVYFVWALIVALAFPPLFGFV